MTLEDWKKALTHHENETKQSQMNIDYGKVVIKTIKRKIKQLEKNAPICTSEGN